MSHSGKQEKYSDLGKALELLINQKNYHFQ